MHKGNYPAGIYLFKINNRNSRTMCETCSKLTIKTPDDVIDFTNCSAVSTVEFEQVNAEWVWANWMTSVLIFLMYLLLKLENVSYICSSVFINGVLIPVNSINSLLVWRGWSYIQQKRYKIILTYHTSFRIAICFFSTIYLTNMVFFD